MKWEGVVYPTINRATTNQLAPSILYLVLPYAILEQGTGGARWARIAEHSIQQLKAVG